MRNEWSVVGLSVVLMAGCASSPAEAPAAAVPKVTGSMRMEAETREGERFSRVTVDQLATRIASKQPLTILDVGERARFAQAHVPGARWASLARPASAGLPEDRTEPIVFYADDELEAAHAAEVVAAMGYPQVSVLMGGIEGWQTAGRDTERSSEPQPASEDE